MQVPVLYRRLQYATESFISRFVMLIAAPPSISLLYRMCVCVYKGTLSRPVIYKSVSIGTRKRSAAIEIELEQQRKSSAKLSNIFYSQNKRRIAIIYRHSIHLKW